MFRILHESSLEPPLTQPVFWTHLCTSQDLLIYVPWPDLWSALKRTAWELLLDCHSDCRACALLDVFPICPTWPGVADLLFFEHWRHQKDGPPLMTWVSAFYFGEKAETQWGEGRRDTTIEGQAHAQDVPPIDPESVWYWENTPVTREGRNPQAGLVAPTNPRNNTWDLSPEECNCRNS